jgi:DNA-binding transcriptional LysR family regulator
MGTKAPPPFTALRAIEAAARHRSYTWAAKELAVTHSAISQSIKRLEAQLGTKLFERRRGAMEPSQAALRLAQAYSDAASALHQSLTEIGHAADQSHLAIALPADLARLWMAPRLPALGRFLPQLSLDILTRIESPLDNGCDLAIGIDLPKRPGWTSETLFELSLIPVCSPSFAKRCRLQKPEDVLRVPLLSEKKLPWRVWMAGAALESSPSQRIHHFDDGALVLESALRDLGLAITYYAAAQEYIESGSLVVPIGLDVRSGHRMTLALNERTEDLELQGQLAGWIRSEFRGTNSAARQPRA